MPFLSPLYQPQSFQRENSNFQFCAEEAQRSVVSIRNLGEVHPDLKGAAELWNTEERFQIYQRLSRSFDCQDRQQAIQIMAYYPESLPILREAIFDHWYLVRLHAIRGLARHNDFSSLDLVHQATNDPVECVKSEAEYAYNILSKNAKREQQSEREFLESLRIQLVLRGGEGLSKTDIPPEKPNASPSPSIPWRFPDGRLNSSELASINAALMHLRNIIVAGSYYTDYLSPLRASCEISSISRSHNHRAVSYGCVGRLSPEDIEKLYESWDGACYWCTAETPRNETHIDHYVPLAKRGPNIPENLVVACADCNLKKSDLDPIEFAARINKREPLERRAAILTLAAISEIDYQKLIKVRGSIDPVIRITYFPQYSSHIFAPTFYDPKVVEIFRDIPLERRLYKGFSSGKPFHSYWVVDDQYFKDVVVSIRELNVQLAFIIPIYESKTFFIPVDREEFRKSRLQAWSGRTSDIVP